jgi:1-acyl-sn-glycerol-3-phosphate acyltransferase
MSDLFYDTLFTLGYPVFWVTGSPVVIGGEVTRRDGPFIVAATHSSAYDIPLLMRHTHRRLDFVSSTEVFAFWFARWLYGSMNAFPLDRSRPDPATVRIILDRLARGRVVGMFPEGGFRKGKASVVHSRKIRSGIGRIAQLANVPIVPAVIINSEVYSRFSSWLPLRRTRYGIFYGSPIDAVGESDEIEEKLVDAFVMLHEQLLHAMSLKASRSSSLSNR